MSLKEPHFAYSTQDLENIAAAIKVNMRRVGELRNQFDAAAAWYRADLGSPRRTPPSSIRRQASAIAAAARRLLRHLEIYDYRKALEGPRDLELLDALALAGNGAEEDVLRASERVARLIDIFDAIDACQELEHRAQQAVKNALEIGRLTTPRGRHGNNALRSWTAEMMPIFKALTGKNPRISVNDRGGPTGPFLRFLIAAGGPLGIREEELTDGARPRARTLVKRAARQK
jgi:hypothetical protein